VPCGLVLANHFGRHSVLELFFVKVVVKLTDAIPVNLYFDLFQTLAQDWLTNVGEEPNDILKVDRGILLQEANDVCFAPRLDEVLEVARLRVVHLQLWLDLSHSIHRVQLPDRDGLLSILLLD